jgi:cytochrome P450
VDVDLYSPAAVRDPWPVLADIRRAGPVVWNSRIDHWMVTSDRLCRQVLLDPERFILSPVTAPFFGAAAFIAIDEREPHDAIRGVWAVTFQRQTLDRLEGVVAEIAERMIDSFAPRLEDGETVDLVRAYCRDLPAYVIAHMLGVPPAHRADIVRWSDLMGAAGGTPNVDRQTDPRWLASEGAKAELAGFLLAEIEHRRRRPGDDLISQIVHSDVGRGMSNEAIMQNARQLLFAGNETTAKWLGHIVVTLASHPAIRDAAIEDASLIAPTIEEIMRWEPVVMRIPRVALNDTEIGGTPVRAGDQILLLTGAANRDPDRYADPDRLDIGRPHQAHLGFGFGMHSCLGVTLARLEARVATTRLLARTPHYRLAGPADYGAFGLRGPSCVEVTARRHGD